MANMLEGKVVLVTGAGGGIGRDFARAAAAEGARVVVNDVGTSVTGEGTSAQAAEQVVREIRDAGGEAVPSFDSVSEWTSANRIVQAALDNFGRIDAVINNAGILRDRFFFSMSVEEWKAVIDVHLNGTFFVSRAAAPHFKSQNGGSYVHITSTSGLIGNLGQANYAAAKMGIVGLSKSIALDMQRYGVRSNCIAPFAFSRMIGAIPAETPDQKARVEKLKRMETHKIAPLAVCLASDAARDVSGQVFAVRANEIFVFGQHRPVRSVHRSGPDGEGWTPQSVAEVALPAMRGNFSPLDRTQDVFTWDPF